MPTDPRNDKARIEQAKGGLLRNLCKYCSRLINQARSRFLFSSVVDLLNDKGYLHPDISDRTCSLCQMLQELAGRQADEVTLNAFAHEGMIENCRDWRPI
jgi:hypothetical protein